MVNPIKITIIINLEPPRNVNKLHTTLGHIGYYRNLIKAYAQITTPMEKLLKRILRSSRKMIVRRSWIL